MNNNKKKSYWLILLFSFSVLTGFNFFQNSINDANIEIMMPSGQSSVLSEENVHLWQSSDGWYDIYYSMSGTELSFAGIPMDYLEEQQPALFSTFSHAHWNFNRDGYVNIELRFFEDDLAVAEGYGNWIMDFVNVLQVTNYFYRGHRTEWDWNPETGNHENVLVLNYEASVEWPHILDQYEEQIPRDQEGLASTINISTCNSLRMNWWKWDEGIGMDYGFSWWYDIEKLVGGHSFDIAELIHVNELKKPIGSESRTNFWISLPNVENISTVPSTGVNIYDHSDERLPWDLEDYYSVELTLDDSLPSITDFILSYDYEFIPWDARNQQYYGIEINPYGYAYERIKVKHEDAIIHDFQPLFDANELWEISTTYYPEIFPWHEHSGQIFVQLLNESAGVPNEETITYWYDQTYIDNQMEQLVDYINFTLGWPVKGNNSYGSIAYFKDWKYPTVNLEVQFDHGYNYANWDYLWNSTWIYSESPYLSNADLKDATEIRDIYYHRPEKGGYAIKELNFEFNSLDPIFETPTKLFNETSGLSHTLNVANQLSMSALEISPSFFYDRIEVLIPESPSNPYFDINEPGQSWGYGFHTGEWFDWREEAVYNSAWLEYYVNNATYELEGSSYDMDNFIIDFNYAFHADTDDIIPPSGDISDKSSYSGISEPIQAYVSDNNHLNWWENGYWNSSTASWVENRFPSSDIASVEYDLYFADLAIEHEDFHWGPFTMSDAGDYWLDYIDTSVLPDGYINVQAFAEDNAGNVGYFGENIFIDNYNDTVFTIPPDIALVDTAPENNSHVSGEVFFQFNITDDVDVFAATVTVGSMPYSGTAYVLDEISPGIFEFAYNSTVEPENEDRYFVITAWDMDGHKIDKIYQYNIDNYPAGYPPLVEILSPEENQIYEGNVLFLVNATDDNGISSVQGQIDDRVPLDMIYNESSGLYQMYYDVSILVNGSHTFTAKVIDIDDPDTSGGGDGRHYVTQSVTFIANTSIDESDLYEPPEVRNILPGNLSSAADILSGTITFSLETKDDLGIESVSITLGTSTDYEDIASVPSDVNTINMQNYLVVDGFPKQMDYVSTDANDWETYEEEYDTVSAPNGIYIVYISIGDSDPTQKQLEIYFIVYINNDAGSDPFAEIPGYSSALLLISLTATFYLIYKKIQR